MVWFQCEDCGENLKKPKLLNHFKICSAYKLSCIDCGEIFTQQTVQGHTQCITEAEKYGPKDQAKSAHNAQNKVNKPKPGLDIDINVGLSTHPPWFCSLCNTTTTSKQTLLLHADGKKHRGKAKAFHASKNQTDKPQVSAANKDDINGVPKIDSADKKSADILDEMKAPSGPFNTKKRKVDAPDHIEHDDVTEMAEANQFCAESVQIGHHQDTKDPAKDSSEQKIRWKKLIVSILKSHPDGVLKVKKLQKLIKKSLQESGMTEGKDQLQTKLMDKITSSSRFIVDGKYIHLANKTKSS
ncbi:unnamed protein product [Spirodela intermedia]|uniref:U1-type domain-containing protein n=1 Tax=Spirodela intermedia TaxID=51605 RepID=A0A7I8J7G3_SPIIN|nr:unnamed protein product [Spirodela intermedia]CAA6666188.1 unnamed protein product [Spirodela intermedia]